ncbi:MAG: 50S ribosomal protein L9, partial [Tepidisphaeraceae bacterium]
MATVKLLLKESIKHLGRVGDVVDVTPGYARNYLLPRDLAVTPTPGNIRKIEERRKEIEKIERERRDQQAALAKALEGVEVTLERRANEQGHLFGSVSATDIAKALQA